MPPIEVLDIVPVFAAPSVESSTVSVSMPAPPLTVSAATTAFAARVACEAAEARADGEGVTALGGAGVALRRRAGGEGRAVEAALEGRAGLVRREREARVAVGDRAGRAERDERVGRRPGGERHRRRRG